LQAGSEFAPYMHRMENGLDDRYRRREPVFLAPWPAAALAAILVVAYVAQTLSGGAEVLGVRYGFTPADLDRGLVTYQFIHGGLAHLALNAVFALAMGSPVARLFGEDGLGALTFFLFYLVCGVLAALGYAAFHLHDADAFLIGASGGVSGLFGAAIRLLGRHGFLAPLSDRKVLTMAGVVLALDVVLGLIGFAPGAGQVTVAWEAHLAGFIAGLVLVGPVVRGIGRR
jgi:membrane associated rhomboid family serine protease